jgi:NitT/TauT family transport system ATP-binding protein
MEICIRGLQKTFGHNGSEVPVLEDINLELGTGEFVSLVGPSGCGKSTLLHIVAGLDRADAGTITVDGQPVNGPGAERVAIFQDPSLFPWLTVRENVEIGLKVRGISPDERRKRAFEYLRMVHLSRFAEHYPKQLSGGMRQRTAIARALALDPQILLMDEPFAALDAQTRLVLLQEVEEIWQQTGKTVLFVSHSLEEALYVSDRIALMTAKPGHISGVFRIESSRPRDVSSPYLQSLQTRMMTHLEAEIAKVAREEMDSDWEFTLGRVPRRPDRDLGGGI